MFPEPQSQRWPGDRALLLVHGIGNARPGDYDGLVAQTRAALGTDAASVAIYVLYYDELDDWMAAKTRAAALVASLVGRLRARIDVHAVSDAIAEFAGDVVWPVLVADARLAVRAACLAQLQQVVLDGIAAHIPARRQHLSIMCHSLGCLHTYEALHAAAASTTDGLAPGTDGVVLDTVLCVASPVQMIRSVAHDLGALVPHPESLACLDAAGLRVPAEPVIGGEAVRSVRRWISLTGKLDPVGGWFFGRRADWAYTELDHQLSIIDEQRALDLETPADLARVLLAALRDGAPPRITAANPHDWSGYVARHTQDLRHWLAPPDAPG